MLHKMRFKDYQKEFLDDLFGVMAQASKMDDYPNLKLIINADDTFSINLMYLAHSGNKKISNLLNMLICDDVASSKEDRTNKLVDVLLVKFGSNWENISKAYNMEYDPLYNYNMLEHEEVNSKMTSSSGSKAKIYGFNSASGEPVDDNEASMENTSEGSKDDNFRDLTRKGNIGVTTSQQMLQSELELRKYDLFNAIFNDIDKVICLKIY